VSGWRRALRRSNLALVGLALCAPIVAVAVLAPWIAPADPMTVNVRQRLLPPDGAHLMGTDVLSREVFGTRTSLLVGVTSVVLGTLIGCGVGAGAGYVRGLLDESLMRLMDTLVAFPAILLALALVVVLGSGVFTVTLAIAVIRIPLFARTSRASVLTERERDYVEAARCIGQQDSLILLRHIFPNILSPVVVLATSSLATGIVIEASLSFLGLGVSAPDVSWGGMLNESRQLLRDYPWLVIFPGAALSLTVLGFNLLGDGVRDLLDPRLRTAI
jgi:ABC-type dipeptide/oligopeptide/nickel transport system permease subunit